MHIQRPRDSDERDCRRAHPSACIQANSFAKSSAMKKRLSITALGSMIHVYPTLTQVNQQAGFEPYSKALRAIRSG